MKRETPETDNEWNREDLHCWSDIADAMREKCGDIEVERNEALLMVSKLKGELAKAHLASIGRER